MSFLIEHTYHY